VQMEWCNPLAHAFRVSQRSHIWDHKALQRPSKRRMLRLAWHDTPPLRVYKAACKLPKWLSSYSCQYVWWQINSILQSDLFINFSHQCSKAIKFEKVTLKFKQHWAR
jgi:hypothetical protein